MKKLPQPNYLYRYESNLVTNFALSNNSKIYSYIKSFSKYSDLPPLIQFKVLILLIKQLYLIISSTLYSTISLQLLLLRTCMCLKNNFVHVLLHFLKWKFISVKASEVDGITSKIWWFTALALYQPVHHLFSFFKILCSKRVENTPDHPYTKNK